MEKSIFIKQTKSRDVAYIQCLVSGQEIKLTPEEAVIQLYLQVLIQRYQYPVSHITVEYAVWEIFEKGQILIYLKKLLLNYLQMVQPKLIIIFMVNPNNNYENIILRYFLLGCFI
ncbi:hypothetical protein ACSQ6I_00660 [Anabaena sp. WFMT]|uniref:hypothetical protein n=1 Tax=Anabaena sp. WFMT TaxID=3449730 RepID=UPI003F2218DC